MRILLLTQLFQPEPNHLKGLNFAKELMCLGHEVEVLTCFPNYPGGRLYSGYTIQPRMREVLDGVSVSRLAHYIDHSTSGLKRFISYTSFAALASIVGPFLIKRPDVIHVYQGPATLCLPAILLRVLFRIPYILDVQDIWPDSVTASGMLNFPGGSDMLDCWCGITYRQASAIVVLSDGYKNALVSRGVEPEKVHVVHNWCNETEMLNGIGHEQVTQKIDMAGKFNVVFAGNMGKVQALNSVIVAASKLQDELPHVQFVFVGDGVELDRLKRFASHIGVSNVLFIPRQPISEIGRILYASDALLIHLKDDPLSRIGIPQKTQAYMAVGKPIIMAVNGDSAHLVRRAEAGVVCEPENPEAIANAISMLVRMNPEERAAMGEKARSFYKRELSFAVGIKKMVSIFEKAAANK